jgi:hypothetical protein
MVGEKKKRRVKQLPVRVTKKKTRGKERLPTVKCTCGVEILLVPNVMVMSKAIETHAEKHKKKIKDPKEAEAEADRVRDELITQVLGKASDE